MSHAAITTQTANTSQRIRLGRSSFLGRATTIGSRLYPCGCSRSRPLRASRLARLLLVAVLTLLPLASRATEPGVRLDFPRGPLISSSRITGLAGAFTGIAEGIDGALKNPASLANRPEHSTSWFDVDIALDWLNAAGSTVDFDADGHTAGDHADFSALNLGFDLTFGSFAFGTLAAIVSWQGGGDEVASVDATLHDVLFAIAQAFDDGSFIIGAGANLRTLELAEHGPTGEATLGLESTTYDFGVLWRPRDAPWRLGAQLRLGGTLARAEDEENSLGLVSAGEFSATYAVRDVVAPWQLSLGYSYRLAADPSRHYNAPLRAGAPQGDRRYVLVSADLVVLGPVDGAVNLEGHIVGDAHPAGRHPSVAVHLGAEGEVLDNRLRARLGAYFEPNRVDDGGLGRLHLTGGFELRLFRLGRLDLKANVAYDLSSRFQNVLIGVGLWH